MHDVKALIWLAVFVVVGIGGISFARAVEDSPRLQGNLKAAFNVDSFYRTVN